MPKNLILQRRGKGGTVFASPSFRFKDVHYPLIKSKENLCAQVVDIIHDPGHSTPLAKIMTENFNEFLNIAVDGINVGQMIEIGEQAKIEKGNIIPLKKIPIGTKVCNIQFNSSKYARTSGAFAVVVGFDGNKAILQMPSKKRVVLNSDAIATIGRAASGGRAKKPFVHAGQCYYKYKAKGKKYPRVGGISMNACDHPHGGKEPRLGKPTTVSRNAPPGCKVGHIAARRTGKRKK